MDQALFILDGIKIGHLQWDEKLQIVYVLAGTMEIEVGQERYELAAEDILVLNPFAPYFVPVCSAEVLTLRFPGELTEKLQNKDGQEVFCCSGIQQEEKKEAFWRLREGLAEAFYICSQNEGASLLLESSLLRVLAILKDNFIIYREHEKVKEYGLERISRILNKIHTEYDRTLTLTEVAESENLSVHYLSRFFHQKTGIGFHEYLSKVRLEAAYDKLCSSKLTVTEIAYSCGFQDATQFIKRFRGRYGMTPGKLRIEKMHIQIQEQYQRKSRDANSLTALLKYRNEQTFKETAVSAKVKKVSASLKTTGKPVLQAWKEILNIGYAKEGLIANVQQQILIIQKEIGFRYIHFHGLLDDDMMIYSEDEQGRPSYNFKSLDILFDFFLSVDLIPYVEFSFMPSCLCGNSGNPFGKNIHFGLPNDIKKWIRLLQEVIRHCIRRYGLEEVLDWRFLIWSGPVGYAEYGGYQFEEFLEFYRKSYEAIRAVHPELKIGGPSMDAAYIWEDENPLEEFVKYTLEKDCFPSFLTLSSYASKIKPDDEESMIRLIENKEAVSWIISRDTEYLTELQNRVKGIVKSCKNINVDLVLTEWNSTPWQRDLTNDTSFKAAYIVKNVLENSRGYQALGYWTLSDYMEEFPLGEETFHGGFGLFTCEGIKKSGYWAFQFLNALGEICIKQGDGYYIARNKRGKIQILLYNYVHYGKLYRYRHTEGVERTDRYGAFLKKEAIQFQVRLNGFQGVQKIRLKKYCISPIEGSACDQWIKMGAPVPLGKEECGYLNKITIPSYSQRKIELEDIFTETFTVPPHSVMLLILEADSYF